jgi:hypothetical protein
MRPGIFPIEPAKVRFADLAPFPARLKNAPAESRRTDLISVEIAAMHKTPLFFVPEDALDDGEVHDP